MKPKKQNRQYEFSPDNPTKLRLLLDEYPLVLSAIADRARIPRQPFYNYVSRSGVKNYETAVKIFDALKHFGVPVESVRDIID